MEATVRGGPEARKYKLEYIWLDGSKPVPRLRSKTTIGSFSQFPTLEQLPLAEFDGAQTGQAELKDDWLILKPVRIASDPARTNGGLVLCEVMMRDARTPHPSNTRAAIASIDEMWVGFEQKYFLYKDGRPLGFPVDGLPRPESSYYGGVGFKNLGEVARRIAEEHMELCLESGLNFEMLLPRAKGSWEYSTFAKDPKSAGDELWLCRYLLSRLSEKYQVDAEHRPAATDSAFFGGASLNCNFSTRYMREIGGKEYFDNLIKAFTEMREQHLIAYGLDPAQPFVYGLQQDDKTSVRVPHSFVNNGYKGYLEERRPPSNTDPYAVIGRIIKTVASVRQTKFIGKVA
ncbi:glutamine synthetase [Bradyrhizobium niftali]|uniref:glutamine synthetase n=1 Tax=Bradyrhizobium niftali TaxID=2560055 RepID=UPI00385111DF